MKKFSALNTEKIKDYIIFLDIDGTLAYDDRTEVSKEVLKKLEIIKKENRVYLCSNSRNHKRNLKIAEITKIEYLNTNLRKPSKKITHLVKEKEGKRLVIGDKLLTDGLFAKNIGADFIQVKRLSSGKERTHIKLLYWIEDLISKIIS